MRTTMWTTRLWWVGLLCIACGAARPADAAVAVVVSTPDANVWHRELAAGLVTELEAQWQILSPPLGADEVGACKTEPSCLRTLAFHRGADWLLVCGIAGVGRRDVVVTLQLFGPDGVARLDDSAIVVLGADPREDGRGLAARVLASEGPAPRPHVDLPTTTPSAMNARAAALVAGGAAVVGAGIGVGAWMLGTSSTRDAALAVVLGSGAVGLAAGGLGVALVWLSRPAETTPALAAKGPGA
jgi:hypothetical protein